MPERFKKWYWLKMETMNAPMGNGTGGVPGYIAFQQTGGLGSVSR